MQQNLFNNYFRKFFGFVLCMIVLGAAVTGAQAQSKVLSDGNPPLTHSMINNLVSVLEWSLQIEFSSEDRSALEQTVARYWKMNDTKSIKAVGNILDFEQKRRAWSDEQQQQAQLELKEKLLEAIERDQKDGMNRLILAIYRRQENGSSTNASSDSSSTNLSQLAGKWQVLHGNSIVGVDINSGRIGDGNQMIAEFDIRSDGRVIYSFVLQQSNYGCTTRLKTSKTGHATIDGSRITFAYDSGTTTSEDNCNARYNYTKKLSAEKETFDFGLKSENGKPQFCFANAKLKDCAVKVR
jgi:hypothetical protein